MPLIMEFFFLFRKWLVINKSDIKINRELIMGLYLTKLRYSCYSHPLTNSIGGFVDSHNSFVNDDVLPQGWEGGLKNSSVGS